MSIYTLMHEEVEVARKELIKKKNVVLQDIVKIFPPSIPKKVEFENLTVTPKTAIVMLGLSMSGKTTLTRLLKEQNEDVLICSMDECSREMYSCGIMNEDVNNIASIEHFGNTLERFAAQNKPVILDGLWINIYTRATLYRSLRKLGYKEICVIDFMKNYDFGAHQDKMISRAVDLLAWKRLLQFRQIRFVREADSLYDKAKALLAEHYGISEKELIERLIQDKEIEELLVGMRDDLISEINDNFVCYQRDNNLFEVGADIVVYL